MLKLRPHYIPCCPEHRCKVFRVKNLYRRAESGEFRLDAIRPKRKLNPFIDHRNIVNTWTELQSIMDDRFPIGHHRHEVALLHRHRADDGTIGGSGMWDPKEMMIRRLFWDLNFREFKTKHGREPHCNLCERGDMIPKKERFFNPKYAPEWSASKRIWKWVVWLPYRVLMGF